MSQAGQVDPQWGARLADAGLRDACTLLRGQPADALGGSWEALVKPGLGGRERWRWRLNSDAAATLYVKRYLRTPWRVQFDRIFRQSPRHSRAWWEFHQSEWLTQRYVPVVQAIAVAEDVRGCLERRSAVIFEPVQGDAFDRVWPKIVATRAALTRPPARHELARGLARFISAFHQTGACHRDLYLCHVFADVDPGARRAPRFALIDLARVHRPRFRRIRWIIKDLSQLDTSAQQLGLTRTDRLRFLVTYLGLEPKSPRVRFYVRRIVRKSRGILRRIARKSGR